jgi:hypothetical protein
MANLRTKLKQWLSKKTEDCKSVSPLFSYAYDRKLSLIEKLRVKLHLYTCGACLNYVSNLKFMHEVFHAQGEVCDNEKLHVPLSAESKQRIKNALKSAK